VDNLKIRLPALLAVLVVSLSATTGCSMRVPTRHAAIDGLVRSGGLDPEAFNGRSDALLGADRSPIVRSIAASTESTLDRQRVIDGRPYADFRVTTRTRSALDR
jgi:hypothetical protein